ncbi:uncharacterized protein LOC122048218 [Zingiber officinale]|uniref:uncharacterized protein LOC122048218 n=1 Tax=Zingiber officinale TaxID=94328 RepID=UPI001C4BA77A|nr:uncharacterized protein LOC122048218 [Zingiber officinale]
MTLTEFFRLGAAPVDPEEARLLKKRFGRFTLIGDQLYKRAFSRLLLNCVGSEDVEYILKEVHQGSCGGYDIQQAFTSVAYPQGNGQAEVVNQKIIRVLLAQLDHMGGNWVDELPSVLWALCTTPKEVTDVTPFQLMYDSEVVVPVEVGVESDRVQHYDDENAERRMMELELVDEARAKAAARLTTYRQWIK